MYALFDDAGKFHAGRLMSETESSVQVELDSGKRVKVKAANVMLRFDKPAPAELMAQAQALAAEIDLALAWEFAPESEFSFADLARDYFDASAGPEKQAAALLRLFDAPHYFRRLGKGLFRKAPEETVKAALLGIERKKQLARADRRLGRRAGAGPLPGAGARAALPHPLQARQERPRIQGRGRGREARAARAAGPAQGRRRHRQRLPVPLAAFPVRAVPQGPRLSRRLAAPEVREPLPLAAVQAFSIDDSATTEIDDALSVTGIGQGTVILGIHIAAPGLAIAPDSALDKVARERLSTVYMPGWKITMLPDAVVQAYTLVEGSDCPALSLYVTLDEATLEVRGTETRIERVPIAANLRHDQLDEVVTEASLTGEAVAEFRFAAELAFCLPPGART